MAFGYYKSITLDHTQVGSTDSTNWPLTVGVGVGPQSADSNLKTVANGGHVQSSSGYDIRPYSDSALTTALTYELVSYDGTNGYLEMHVKIPTLSHSADTVIYLAYGNAALTTDGSSTATWDSNFQGVWHFQNLGAGSGATTTDSTSNALTLTDHGNNWTNPAAVIGNGATSAENNTGIGMDNPTTSLLVTGDFTVEAWVKIASAHYTDSNWGLLSQWSTNGWLIYQSGSGTYYLYTDGNHTGFPNAVPNDSAWHHIVINIQNSNAHVILYVDGVSQGTNINSGSTITSAATKLNLGNYNGLAGQSIFGSLDEVRLSNSVRSADWVKATYNAQKASSTLITWGSETAVGGTTGFVMTFI